MSLFSSIDPPTVSMSAEVWTIGMGGLRMFFHVRNVDVLYKLSWEWFPPGARPDITFTVLQVKC